MGNRQFYLLVFVYVLATVCSCNTLREDNFKEQEINERVQGLSDQVEELKTRILNMEIKTDQTESSGKDKPTCCGPPGSPGTPGPQGSPGRDGRDGKDGSDGNDGRDGDDGRDGRDGSPGPQGLPGNDGEPGVAGPKGDVGPTGPAAGGATYTRWGRTSCGANSTLVYVGFMGKSPHTHVGGGINYQCMVNDAEYNSAGVAALFGTVAGVEYETGSFGIFENEANDQNAPCAVCYANNRTSTLMVPGKRSCPTDWTTEYEGYLMSSLFSHPNPSTYECIDKDPEYVTGESADDNGGLLYFNRAVCSQGIDCPDYDSDRAITCVVCTQ